MAFKENEPGIWSYENEDDKITGVLIQIQTEVGPTKSKLYSVETKDDGVQNIWGSAILDQRMVGVKVGDLIQIVYKGLGEAAPGKNAPKIFKVLVDRPEVKTEDKQVETSSEESN